MMPTVLVIEDDPDMRELERVALGCGGYGTALAANGREALQILTNVRPCAIVLDLMMPVMDGLSFLAALHHTEERDVPVVCVTAASASMIAEALRRGARECLPKPTDIDQLCAIVDRYCGVS